MGYLYGQIPVSNASTAAVLTVPDGLMNLNFWTTSAIPLYLGTSSKVSPVSGLQAPTIPTNINSFVPSRGCMLYAANTSASTVTLNYALVTNQ